MDILDRIIAKKLFGGSGGGGDEADRVEVLAKCQPPFDDSYGYFILQNQCQLEIGKNYIVDWNGTEYTGTVIDGSPEGFGDNSAVLVNDGADKETGEGTVFIITYTKFSTGDDEIHIIDPSGSDSLTIAIYQVAGGGGGGVSSWNDLTDKPFYEETSVVEVVPETTELQVVNKAKMLVEGETYIVTWDGVEYRCNAFTIPSIEAWVCLGNFKEAGATDTGEPFAIYECEDTDFPGTYVIRAASDHTWSIDRVATIIHPIEGKYLPKGTPWIEEGEMVEVLPEYTITEDNMDADVAGIPALGLVKGNTYVVKLQGTEYTCVAWETTQEGLTMVGLGDIYTASEGAFGTAATGEPFILMEVPPEAVAELGVNVTVQPLVEMAFPIVFSINSKDEVVQKIDNRCLPGGIPYANEFDDIILPEVVVSPGVRSDKIGNILAGSIYNVIYNGTPYLFEAQKAVNDEYHDIVLSHYYDENYYLRKARFRIEVYKPGYQAAGASYDVYGVQDGDTLAIIGGVKTKQIHPLSLPSLGRVVYVDITDDGEGNLTASMTGEEIATAFGRGYFLVCRCDNAVFNATAVSESGDEVTFGGVYTNGEYIFVNTIYINKFSNEARHEQKYINPNITSSN